MGELWLCGKLAEAATNLVDAVRSPLVSLVKAGEVYLLMKAERDRVETRLMELELTQRMREEGAKQPRDDWRGFHGRKECD